MKKIITKSLLVALSLGVVTLFIICEGCNKDSSTINTIKDTDKPLNISIYLDLSDRLLKGGTPDQKERDLAIVDTIAGCFKNATVNSKILKNKNKMKVFFYPAPHDKGINALADSLSIDIDKLKGIKKRVEAENLKNKLNNALSQIYDLTLKDQNWIGSDIWSFFSDSTKIDVQCIDKGARNIIIIITDGFLFHVDSKQKDGDAYSYILLQTLANPKSSLIVNRKGLGDLEVLMLETAPEALKLNINQKQKLRSVLENWFSGMGVKRFQIVEADIPSNTATTIEKFLKDE